MGMFTITITILVPDFLLSYILGWLLSDLPISKLLLLTKTKNQKMVTNTPDIITIPV